MEYVAPLNATEDNNNYVNANPLTGQKGSTISASAIEHPMREILAVITEAGLTPDEEDLTQLSQAIEVMISPKADINANVISLTGATLSLDIGKDYSVNITENTTFTLPEAIEDKTNTITADVTITEITITTPSEIEGEDDIVTTSLPTIDWGTTKFFNRITPEIESGCYSVIWDYSDQDNAWFCGVISKGVEE